MSAYINACRVNSNTLFNPTPPSDVVRQLKILFSRIFPVIVTALKKITPLETWNSIISAISKA